MIRIEKWEREAPDYNGKIQPEIFHVSIGGAKAKALSKADLLRAVKMNLPECGAGDGVAQHEPVNGFGARV